MATLTQTLRPKRLLLVLDDCEHLIQACAELVHVLLRTSPQLRILATSREPLGVDGETTWSVPPLSLGTPEAPAEEQARSDAVRLFIERAQAVRPEFALTEANTSTIAAICRALDGIPLALELAAARIRMLGPEEVLARMGRGRVIQDWDDDQAIRILTTCRAAISQDGKLLLVETVVKPPNEPDPVKFTDLRMLVMNGGRERTVTEFRQLFAAAGFCLSRMIPTPTPFSILEGAPA